MPRSVLHFDPALLRKARKEAGLRQEDAAEAAGMARTNSNATETGRGHSPGPAGLVRLAGAVKVEPWELSGITRDQATLRDLREWRGLNSNEVIERLDTWGTRRQLDRIEHGNAELSADQVPKLAALYDVDEATLRAAGEATLRRG